MNGLDQQHLSELEKQLQETRSALDAYKAKALDLNMARGKPCTSQLDLSDGLISWDAQLKEGTDYRNYGILDGIPELKDIFAKVLDVDSDECFIGGSSSLNLMYDMVSKAMFLGTADSDKPWGSQGKVSFLCPVPGYDRHFGVCEALGINMITIPMNNDGPDMDQVEAMVKEDPMIKGIWCVPKYANPSGITYSDDVVHRLASMETAAKDFRIFWDNAYAVHHLTDEPDELKSILEACKQFGNPTRVYLFASTSKITYAGAGVAAMAMDKRNLAFIKKQMSYQTIGYNKVNQLLHARFLKDFDGLTEHMKGHAAILAPKFERVLSILKEELSDTSFASWNEPKGGYFISLDVVPHTAKAVVRRCLDCGVTLTPAGATYPYGQDPEDKNIRIAPTFPPLDELETAIRILCLCVKEAAYEQQIENFENQSI